MRPSLLTALAIAVVLGLSAAACGDDSDDSASPGTTAPGDATTTTTAATSTTAPNTASPDGAGKPHTEASAAELEKWQTDLNAVGCYVGPVDGSLGPQTEAAIKAFQAAEGLTVDGLLGPQTEAALEQAVTAGEIVCTTTTGGATTAPATSAAVSLSSASYDKAFTVGTCSLNADVSNVSLRGQADGLTLVVDATEGTGTLAVSGGTESDGITLNGDITAVTIDADRSFTATGEFGEPNNVGETFTLTGACPES